MALGELGPDITGQWRTVLIMVSAQSKFTIQHIFLSSTNFYAVISCSLQPTWNGYLVLHIEEDCDTLIGNRRKDWGNSLVLAAMREERILAYMSSFCHFSIRKQEEHFLKESLCPFPNDKRVFSVPCHVSG